MKAKEKRQLVIKIITERGPITSREIIDIINQTTTIKRTTIGRIIQVLEKEGLVRCYKQGIAYYYEIND